MPLPSFSISFKFHEYFFHFYHASNSLTFIWFLEKKILTEKNYCEKNLFLFISLQSFFLLSCFAQHMQTTMPYATHNQNIELNCHTWRHYFIHRLTNDNNTFVWILSLPHIWTRAAVFVWTKVYSAAHFSV